MTTLTRAKKMSRVAAVGLMVAFVVYLVVRITLNYVFSLNTNNKEAKRDAIASLPNVAFGLLPAPRLQPAQVTSATATVQLDLVAGEMPQSTASASVFKVATPNLTLSAQDRARQRGDSLGFSNAPDDSDPVTFSWSDAWRQLDIDLSSQTFNLSTDLPKVDFSRRTNFTSISDLVRPVGQYAQRLFNYEDINFQQPIIRFVNPAGDGVLPQNDEAVATTNFAQVSFLRNKIGETPIYDGNGKRGPINMVIIPSMVGQENSRTANTIKLDQIVQFSSHYFPIDLNKSSIYPVISPNDAYTLLKSNIGRYLVSVEPTGIQQAKSFITGRVLFVSLVYLEPDAQNMQYVQPMWMFEGRGTTDVGEAKWLAYVPAIDQTATNQLLNRK